MARPQRRGGLWNGQAGIGQHWHGSRGQARSRLEGKAKDRLGSRGQASDRPDGAVTGADCKGVEWQPRNGKDRRGMARIGMVFYVTDILMSGLSMSSVLTVILVVWAIGGRFIRIVLGQAFSWR